MPSSTEREQFDTHLGALFGGFPPMILTPDRKEGYWRGLAKMPLLTFERCVNRALDGEVGEEKLPSPKRLWQISRDLRHESRAAAQPPATPPREYDVFDAYANRVMLLFFLNRASPSTQVMRGAATAESLAAMIRAKDKLAADYRLICTEEPEASLELRDKLMEKFTELFVPVGAAEGNTRISGGEFRRIGAAVQEIPA